MGTENKEEFSLLLKDALAVMYRVSLRLTKDRMDAEDLIAEACLKAWEKFPTLRNHHSFRPWILRICQNLYISTYRKKQREKEPLKESQLLGEDEDFSLFEQLVSPLILDNSNPEIAFINALSSEQITKALSCLPEKYKTVVMLCCFEELPYQEAARILKLPIGTVRSRLHRGRAILQKLLWEVAKEKGII
ncbi:MAG: sigma-70 family RNA polymerase sigma factor [bacterium]|nr:sigma-70 family RNA polymerase sigma factor [bacterium]